MPARKTVLVGIAFGLVLLDVIPCAAEEPAPLRNRNEFAAALAGIEPGIPATEVIARLGNPDDIRTHRDPGGMHTTRTKEIWCYGTDGHLTFPTLGRVYIDVNEEVQYVFGGRETPMGSDLFAEEEIRTFLRLIDTAPSYQHGYDPLPVIQIVNALQPLGKTKALALIDEYLRVSSRWHSDARDGQFLVLRVLFEVPEDPGHMPVMRVGAPSPPEPDDPTLFPRFPIVIIDDVPLLLINGYTLFGRAQPVRDHVSYFRRNGRLRESPFLPPDSPLELLDKLTNSKAWTSWRGGSSRQVKQTMDIAQQLLRLVKTVYTADTGPSGRIRYDSCSPGDADRAWQSIVTDFDRLAVVWDAQQNIYTRADGSSLSQRRIIYQREMWEPRSSVGTVKLILERKTENHVELRVTAKALPGEGIPSGVVQVYSSSDPEVSLATVDVFGHSDSLLNWPEEFRAERMEQREESRRRTLESGGGWYGGANFDLEAGTQIFITYTEDGLSQKSPPLQP